MKMKWLPVALAISALAHVGLAALRPAAPGPLLEGGEVAGEIALGSGFADLVAGVQAPVRATPTQQAEVAEVVAPVEAPPVAQEAPAAPAAQTAPASQAAPAPEAPTQNAVLPQATSQAAPERLARAAPRETIKARPTPPQVRPASEAKVKPQARPKPETATSKPPPEARKPTANAPETVQARGNGAVNARKGQAEGSNTGKAAEATKGATSTTAKRAGAGAVKTYQSYVLHRIARVPKRAAGARGTAHVGLSIGGGGQIAGVRIVRSSGNGAIDRLALAQVRRAGPFKPTPGGQPVKVVVRFESKS